MKWTKEQVERSALGGGRLDWTDVLRTSRNHRSMTLRHSWPEGTDARVWDAVSRAMMRGARQMANSKGHDVEIYTHDGFMLEIVQPDEGKV